MQRHSLRRRGNGNGNGNAPPLEHPMLTDKGCCEKRWSGRVRQTSIKGQAVQSLKHKLAVGMCGP